MTVATVVIPCYNHNEEVHRAVQSALAQDEPVDIIVVDDGSATPVQNEWGDRVTVIRHPTNMGLSTALNTGILACETPWFVICAADDELHPAHVAITSTQSKDVDIVSVDMLANGRYVRMRAGDLETLKRSNCHSYAALVRKELWRKVGGFKVGMDPSWEDYEFWFNCAKNEARWQHVQMPLHIYHRTEQGRDAQAQGQDRMLRGLLEGHHQDVFGVGRGLVCFVIPCYNHNQYVPDALVSVMNQSYPHFTAVVVDDGSTLPFSSTMVPVLRQDNKGLSAARNAGIKYALETWNPQYFVMLDADDTVHPNFVRRTMATMQRPNEFVYTDVHFIGDAWHDYELQDFNCEKLKHTHLHPCTFLMTAELPKRLQERRGYVYDEHPTMRIGFEDWEFSLAAVEVQFCGKHLAEKLFNYRFHNNGSMRIEAEKQRGRLMSYIRSKHLWMTGGVNMCTSCGGGGAHTMTHNGKVLVAGVGEFAPGAPLEVTYIGTNQSTKTKIGAGGRIYRYSGQAAGPKVKFPRSFPIDARDAPLFVGPFQIKSLTPAEPTATPLPVEISEELLIGPRAPRQGPMTLDQVLPQDTGFDFTQIPGVGPATNAKLKKAGVTTLPQLRTKTERELVDILGHERAAKLLMQAVVSYVG